MRWQRLDMPGSDECELVRATGGWRLSGTATYGIAPRVARLTYMVEADAAWQTQRGVVRGTMGARDIAIEMQRLPTGQWRVDGRAAPELEGLVDLDLGFTPSTNLFPLRRLALRPGDGAAAAAAWLNEADWSVTRLPQRYERRDAEHYWYEAPTVGYAGMLTVTLDGFVSEYPGLWRAADR